MPEMSNKWAQLIEQYNQTFLSSRNTDWLPDDGEYYAILSEVQRIEYKDESGADRIAWAPVAEIIDHPQYTGRRFRIGFFTPERLAYFGTLLDPKNNWAEPQSLAEADTALTNSVGQVIRVRVRTVKRRGQEYRNARVVDYVEHTDATTTETTA